MKLKVQDELKALGSDLDAVDFCDRLADLYAETNRNCTVDDFLCRRREVDHFCALARCLMKLPAEADELILRTLLRIRKRGGGELRLEEQPA